ncbi:MAG: tRNA (N6-isopentenyl adenosine(37)-C2)-methylthiotransferase MiaB [Ruminococcaceae bacterium]|nr:tRNA (N6-isopentenyl adenosine(37)-C2)-methylthiotransferase MiaB [Oscillospiraceae bacterium]
MRSVFVDNVQLEKQKEFAAFAGEILAARYAQPPKAYVHTYGCQGNVADSEKIEGMLLQIGYELTEDLSEADLVLYNTCAIREHAEHRVFGNVGALKHYKARKKDMIIALCGCMMQQSQVAEKIKKSYPFVNLVFGTHVVHRLPEFIYRVLCGNKVVCIDENEGVIAEGLPIHRDGSFKAWLPIMYGCNNFCSYCIVPYVRGRERSRRQSDILAEARQIIAAGYKEITLLGQNVNSYGNDLEDGSNFASLLRALDAMEGDFKIRFMTSHPKDCTKELIDTIAASRHISHHLHLPFQSGNDDILKAMNRKYTREKYLELVNYAKSKISDLSLTSDVIVGFPGETYEQFSDTLSLIREVKFTSLFTFIFSPRHGTPAEKMDDPVPAEEKGKWFRELLDVQAEVAAGRTAAMKGKVYRALVEEPGKEAGHLCGRTDANVIIDFEGDESLIGQYVNVKVTDSLTWIVKGELL